jgi:SH3-like domain-containing protein
MSAQATFRVLNTSTAQVMASSTARAMSQSRQCEGQMDKLMTHEQLIEALTSDLAADIANYIAPRFDLQKFDLKHVHGTHDQEQLAERAEKLAHDLNVDQAYVIYQGMYDKDSYNPDLLHDLAVLNEVVGNLPRSLELYQSRCQLKSDGDCRDAIERVQQSIAFRQALTQLGITFTDHTWETSAAALETATMSQLEIKGGNDERFSVFAEPREGSAVLAAVPGGITLNIVRQEGDWYRVKLLGGKEGYIQSSRVKLK